MRKSGGRGTFPGFYLNTKYNGIKPESIKQEQTIKS